MCHYQIISLADIGEAPPESPGRAVLVPIGDARSANWYSCRQTGPEISSCGSARMHLEYHADMLSLDMSSHRPAGTADISMQCTDQDSQDFENKIHLINK